MVHILYSRLLPLYSDAEKKCTFNEHVVRTTAQNPNIYHYFKAKLLYKLSTTFAECLILVSCYVYQFVEIEIDDLQIFFT